MPYDGFVASSAHSQEAMQAALEYLARMMKEQPEARKLVPIFRALKDKIAAARNEEDVLAEALALVDTLS
jgi:hypothetical protein